MEFIDRKMKCKKIQRTDINGEIYPDEAFYALITDAAVEQDGTPINAENMNKGNWRDDTSLSFSSIATTPQVWAEQNATKLYTDTDGETWIVPPLGKADRYKLSLGKLAYENTCELFDPTTGYKNSLQSIVNNIFNAVTQPFTAQEYDSLNISATSYDSKNIGALDFDTRGRSII